MIPIKQEQMITWVDKWGATHIMTVGKATEFLQAFFNEWPGGMEEIESTMQLKSKKPSGEVSKLFGLP